MPKAPEVSVYDAAQLAKAGPFELSDHLENSRIVLFSTSPVQLPSPDDLDFLRTELPSLISLKNISFYPDADRVYGLSADRGVVERTTRILKAHRDRVDAFLRRTLSAFVPNWVEGTTSFRPLEEKGRNLSKHASNELLHIDAGAYGATHGARIFRFFTNINATEPRVWRVKGTFPDLLQEYGRAAGIVNGGGPRLDEGVLDRLFSGFIRGVSAVVPMARSLDSSPYDRAMRRMHNYMKDSESFQTEDAGSRIVTFGPMTSWMVFTDMVGHSCISGQHMLSNTYVIPRENCRNQELTPYACLARGADSR
jgi:hypothetical protein